MLIFPGLVDAHVHFREPGLIQELASGSRAGYGRYRHNGHGDADRQTHDDHARSLPRKKSAG